GGTVIVVSLIFGLTLAGASGSCGGTLDCAPLGETDCNTCSQCSWSDASCAGSIDDCSTFDNQSLCEDDCGCNWDEAECYDDPSATDCSDFSNETDCQNQDGCVWQKYSTDNPDIYPSDPYKAPGVLSWDGFTETATKDGGEIYYQLSDDNGSTWKYWNGSAWSEASSTDYNIASVVDTNISEFSTSSEQIKFRAFLESDGSQQIQLDNISLDLTPSPQVWSFNTWDAGGGEVTPTGNRQYSGGNPDNYVDITVPASRNDEVGGYWEQAFEVTAANPSTNINFNYKVIDFNEIPSVGEIRIYVDSFSGDPVTQVGDSIPLNGEGSWISVSSLDASSVITATGTYYLKLALWVESSFWEEGPFTVGFDNAFLSWNAGSYASDQPAIRNSSSFEPTVINSWISFVETASKYSGEIYYQLSDDDGSTWQYWNGANWVDDPDGDEGSGENDYNTAYTVNNYINLFDPANKKIMYKAFLAGNGSSTIELDNIKIGYNITDALYLGNNFTVSEVFGANALWQDDYTASMRFRAQQGKTVDSIRVYLDDENGNSPTYRYGLQTDSGGSPSGTWLGSANQGYGDLQATSPGWKTIGLNENVSLTQGITYHLVTQYQSGTINYFRSVELRASNPNNFLNPLNNSSNSSGNYLWSTDGGSSWSALGYQPIYVLGFTDGSFEGNPYEDLSEISVYGNNYAGQEFSFPSEKKISSLAFLVSDNDSNPSDSLYVSLYDVSGSTQLAGGELAKATGTSATYEWKDYEFSSPIVLDANKIYRAYIYSPSSDSTEYYRVRAIYHNDNSALNSINYQATSSYYISSSDGGGSWDTTNPNYDIGGFRMASTLYKTSGYLISSAFDAGTPANFNALDWSGQTPVCSPACEIKAQIRTAPDSSGFPGAWSATWCGPEGEDGDESDYFTVGAGELIHTDHNNDQWIKYKVFLSGDSAETPILEDINIFYK
ncbi:MAG TPA: hypothetical protein VKO42_02995, partial [Patescibacteria group bacterium]|nr:hypothetical protein [Patescibacteria group bacterium]